MNDKDIERAAINEILKEAKHTEDRNKVPETGLGINKRLLSQNLVSTLRDPVFFRKFQKHRIIGLDDETESDFEDDTNHAKWKRDGDYSHLGDDDYIYDARDYFNPNKYREIVAYRCQKLQKYKHKSSKTHKSAKDTRSDRHGGHPSKYMDSPQKQKRSECEGAMSDGLVNSSRKKKHHKDKDRVKKTKYRKKSKHKRCDDDIVDKVFEEHKKHAKRKKHKNKSDKKDKLSKRRAKKSKKSKSSCHSDDKLLKVGVLESPPHGEPYNFSLPRPFDQYDDRYDSKYSESNGCYRNQVSDSCWSPENVGDIKYVDGTEISYDDCSPHLQEFSNNCTYF